MNKLRLIMIYELRGKIHPIKAFMIDLLDGIEKEIYPGHIEYKKNGIYYILYYLNNNDIYLNSIIYNDFNSNFGCSYDETMVIMKYLLEKHLNITINKVI